MDNEEYRRFFRDGRISLENLARAFQRKGPCQQQLHSIQIESRHINACDVWWLHLIVGFEPLESARPECELGDNGPTTKFHPFLPEECRNRIIDRTIQECELCRDYPEMAYLANLWKSVLSVLQLGESRVSPQHVDCSVSAVKRTVSLEYDALVSERSLPLGKRKQRICRDAWRIFHLAQFLELSPIDVLDLSFADAQTLVQWLDDFPLDQHGLVWLKAYEESFRADVL